MGVFTQVVWPRGHQGGPGGRRLDGAVSFPQFKFGDDGCGTWPMYQVIPGAYDGIFEGWTDHRTDHIDCWVVVKGKAVIAVIPGKEGEVGHLTPAFLSQIYEVPVQ